MSDHSPLTTHHSPSDAPSDAPRPWRVAVIGGGITGLAAAHRLQELCAEARRPLQLTLFESADRLGGVVGTCRIGEYLVELGADSFITNKPWAADLCRRLGLEDRLIPTDPTYRRSLVLRNGKPVAVPEGFMLLSPARLWPVLASPIFSPWGKLRMGLEYLIPPRRDNGDESLASFVRRRFGREALERLVQPLVGGIYTSDPEKLSLQATMPRFLEMERQHGSLIRASRKQQSQEPAAEARSTRLAATLGERETQVSGARYGLFATLAGGLLELVDTLAERVSRLATIRLNTAATKLCRAVEDGPFRLMFADASREKDEVRRMNDEGRMVSRGVMSDTEFTCAAGTPHYSPLATHQTVHPSSFILHPSTEEFDSVILAVPAYRAAELLSKMDSVLATSLSEIEYASSAVVVTGHKFSDIRHPLDAFGLVVPAIENRRILAVSFASRKFPGRAPEGHVLLRTFVGGALQPELLEQSDANLVGIVRAELADILGVTGREDFARVARYTRAMPQYHVGHLDLVARIEDRVKHHPGLQLAGNAYHGVGLPDCIHSGESAAERLIHV